MQFLTNPMGIPKRHLENKRSKRRQAWFPGETVILGIGQGYMQVTPLQLAQATALIANKGVWNRPHLAKTIDGTPPADQNPMPNIVLHDPKEWEQVNHAMQLVMHDPRGIARAAAQGAQYRIAGKSGTAQVVAIKQGERYNRLKTAERNRDHALFVGFAPADDPKIVVAVMVENGESGSGVATRLLQLPNVELDDALDKRNNWLSISAEPPRQPNTAYKTVVAEHVKSKTKGKGLSAP